MSEKEPANFELLFGIKQYGMRENRKPINILPRANSQNPTSSYAFLEYKRKRHPIKPGKLCKKVFPEDYEEELQNQDNDFGLNK